MAHAIFSRFWADFISASDTDFILFGVFKWFGEFLPHIWGRTVLFILGMIIYLLNSRLNPTAKITRLIVIMLLPVFGVLLFLYTQSDIGHRVLKSGLIILSRRIRKAYPSQRKFWNALQKKIRVWRRWLIMCIEAAVFRYLPIQM